jgi:ribose/xylose/arabinose/galactoside ABC-type transport system permease subunit/ABC-type branched-subunit amino acid transport system ATPase component
MSRHPVSDAARTLDHARPSRVFPRHHIGGGTNRAGLAALAVALVIIFQWRSGNFATYSNLTAIMVNTSAILLASIAVARLLIAGAVDLSLGGMYALIAVISASAARSTGSASAAVVTGIVLGLGLGLVNGTLVRLLRMSSIIVTLALGAIYRGLALVATDARSVTGLPDQFVQLGRSRLLGIPTPVVFSVAIFVIGAVLLTRTVGGMRSYAVGGSPTASQLAGVSVDRHRLWLYAYSGGTMGVVALLGTSRLGSGTPTIGAQFEIDVLTAVILGGVAFAGGRGRPVGVFVGVVIIGILNAGMIFIGLTDFYQQIAKGAVLLLALGADQLLAGRKGRASAGEAALPAKPLRRDTGPSAHVPSDAAGRADAAADGPVVLSATALAKSYGPVAAVRNVSLRACAGQVLCLVGDNGAGKSTVTRMLAGVERPDGGTLYLDDLPILLDGPADARRRGIEVVHQNLALCPNLGAAYNLALGREPRRFRLGSLSLLDRRAAVSEARQRLRRLDVDLDDQLRPVAELSGGQRQAVAISRAMRDGARVVILDEPTAALGVSQTGSVLRLVRTLAEHGSAVIMITHDVQAVLDVSDRVAVLNLGRVTFDGPTSTLTDRDLVHLMAGLPPEELTSSSATTTTAGSQQVDGKVTP